MFDQDLILLLPTLSELLGPDWEKCSYRQAKLAIKAESAAWPSALFRQVDESMRTLHSSWWISRLFSEPPELNLGQEVQDELRRLRDLLKSGEKISGVGPVRRKILNWLFEIEE